MRGTFMECLVKWANTFEGLSKQCTTITDFSDGVILEEILAQVAPKYFNEENIKRDMEDNWVLKTNNIKKIVAILDKFFQMELGIHYGVDIDASKVAKDENPQEIVRLVELVLGVMVESEHKNEYIGNIMIMLDEATQRELMVILEGIVYKHQVEMSTDHSFHDSSNTIEDARITELQNHIDQLTRELYEEKEQHSDLKQEHEIAKEQVRTLKSERESLQHAVYELEDNLKAEKEKAKTEKENYTAVSLPRQSSQTALLDEERTLVWTSQIEERDRTIAELKKKIEEFAKQASETRTLRDELDILREKALLATGLEEKLKKAQLKSEQVNDLRKQIKMLEEQNDQSLKRALDAEDATLKAGSNKSQIETYKQQLAQIKTEHAQLEVATKSQQNEIDRLKNELNTANLENSGLKFRVDSLQAEVNDLNSVHGSSGHDDSFEHGTSLGESFVPQYKERIAVLERENSRLREKNSVELEQRLSELTHQLDDANKLNELLKKELEKGGGGGGVSAAAQAEIDTLKDQLNKLVEENKTNLAEMNLLLKEKSEAAQFKTTNEHLTDKLKTAAEKIAALSSEKTKHEGFLRAAKSIISEQREQIKQLNEKGSEKNKKDLEEMVQTYRNQLKEKDQQIEMITKLWEEGKENSAREQRLMTSAFYDMGLELHRLRAAKTTATSPSSPVPPSASSSHTPATPRSLLGNLRQNRE